MDDVGDEKLEEKKIAVTDRLQKRDQERLEDIQKRKEEKDSTSAKDESLDLFIKNYSAAQSEIQSFLDQCESVDKRSISDHLDKILMRILELQKYATDSRMFITAYELEKVQEIVKSLYSCYLEKKEALIPKKKFAFSSKKKAGAAPKEDIQLKKEKVALKVDENDCRISDLDGKEVIKTSSEINSKDVLVSRLIDCTVFLKGSMGTLHMNNLRKCTIYSGPVAGSIFIDNCEECTFIVACQQLRIHTTKRCSFYIHVTSKAIIEDSTNVQFAPFDWSYEELSDHYKTSGLDRSINNWSDIDDFNWLASDKHSPNWSILAEDQRQSH